MERPIQWRRDVSTSRSVRLLRAAGVGTFLAAIVLIVFARLFSFAGAVGGQSLVVAALVVAAGTLLVAAALSRLGVLPDGTVAGPVVDAGLAAIVAGVLIFGLVRGVGGGVGNLLAALSIPLAMLALVGSSFLQSTGTLDPEEGVIYLHEPEGSIDLDLLRGVSVRQVGGVAILRLRYARPDGRYVQGPRRLVVPPEVATELERLVDSR